MATRKVTVTIDEAQLAHVQELVHEGQAASVSGFVQQAIALALDDIAGFASLLDAALAATGGPLTDDERAWADTALGAPQRRGSGHHAA